MQHQKSIQARNHRSGFGTSVQARLAASIVAILGVAATSESSMASTIVVSRCNDLPPGHGVKGESLRTAIGKAVDADLVDLSGLDTSCSTITLQSGEIPIGLANLAIRGPTGHVLTIDGNHVGRVFYHSGKGVLTISSLSLANGRTSGNGGCLYSNGAVMLDHLSVTGCHAVNGGGVFSSGPTPSNVAKYPTTLAFVTLSGNVADQTGGGIYNQSLLTLQSSLVDGNTAAFVGGGVFDNGTTPTSDFPPTYGTTYIQATVVSGNSARYQGGGISTSGPLITTYSTISDNKSYLLGGGGVAVFANFMNIQSSTIAHNTAFGVAGSAIGGGLLFTSGPTFLPQTPRIVSSTISGNTAPTAGGASITWRYGSFEMDNSTVAFNSAEPGSAAGLAVTGCYTHLLSSILAENVGGSPDLVTNQSCNSYQLPVLDGMGSIVMSSNQQPTNTTVANPHLAPLAWHGGPTQVHALSANSVAIGHGANPRNFDNDQRGPGFPRTIGHITDSGAYQRQINNDELFFSGFDD